MRPSMKLSTPFTRTSIETGVRLWLRAVGERGFVMGGGYARMVNFPVTMIGSKPPIGVLLQAAADNGLP
jgi:hypothetical protein